MLLASQVVLEGAGAMFDGVLKHRSGRIIALCRIALAVTFLFAIWADRSQPAHAVALTYALLTVYLAIATAIAALTWNNWWLDAKLAAPAHILDIAAFTALVFATDGYTSPFFVFFVFLILSAAIRWGWRETALTAGAVIVLYLVAGLLAGHPEGRSFELQRFIVRSGHLFILSAIVIWFGVNKGFSGFTFDADNVLPNPRPGDPPLQSAVEGAMELTGATSALLLWRSSDADEPVAIGFGEKGVSNAAVSQMSARPKHSHPFLFDARRNRALWRGAGGRMRPFPANEAIGITEAREFGIEQGLAVPIKTEAGEGKILLGGISGLCTDHIEFGNYVRSAVAAHIQRHAFISAVEEGAAARARLSLARDLHDSTVQFLAGATFRIEAISRALRAGERPARELKELKQLLLQEQQELRSAIGALRNEKIALPALAGDLKILCGRLARQWDIRCNFSAEVPDVMAPMRLHLDMHQLIREAVANAVRHAQAKSIRVQLTAEDSDLRLDIDNDGSGSKRLKEDRPWSLRERVDEARGTLMLATRGSGTNLSITLPLKGRA
jgi:signal transduction histidine kinase